MNENRVGHAGHHHHHHHHQAIRGHPHQVEPCNELDVLAQSESAHIQEFRLYRELSREIEKNTSDRVRYVDSDLYQRGLQQQSSDLRYSNAGSATTISEAHHGPLSPGPAQTSAKVGAKLKQSLSSSSATATPSNKSHFLGPANNRSHSSNDIEDKVSFSADSTAPTGPRRAHPKPAGAFGDNNDDAKHEDQDGNCQACLVRGLRDDLMQVTRVIQERNEQLLTELKAKRSRAFFERLDQ